MSHITPSVKFQLEESWTTGFYGFKDIFLVDWMSCTGTIMVDVRAAGLWSLTAATMGKQPIMLTRAVIHL